MTEQPEHYCHPRGGVAGDVFTCPCGRVLTCHITDYGSMFWATEESYPEISQTIANVEAQASLGQPTSEEI